MLVLSALLAPPSFADTQLEPLNFKGKYTVSWSGIPVGRIILEAHENDKTYGMTIDSKTKGVGSLVSDEKRIISVKGSKSGNEYIPNLYQSLPQKKDEDANTLILSYDAEGKLSKRDRAKDDDPAWRPPVPVEEANTAHDPVTAAFMLRRKLYAAVAKGESEVMTRTYDGMRLATMKLVRAREDAQLTVLNETKPAINALILREPINGYTPKELKKYKKGDPEIRIYFTHDDAFWPVRVTTKTLLGELSMSLSEIPK